MPVRKIALLLVALVIAIGTVFLARAMMHPGAKVTAAAPPPANEVLAAARDLPIGTLLKEADVKWVPWPVENESPNLFVKGKSEMPQVTGAVLRQALHADEPLLAGYIVHPHEQGFLAAVLTPGMRAMSITVKPDADVAGFIFPGDRVDVILTHVIKRKDVPNLDDRHVSETVLSNVRVLALDQKSDTLSVDPKVAQLVTLEVTPKQAEALALATDLVNQMDGGHGILSLALCSLASDENPGSKDAAPSTSIGPTWDSDISHVIPSPSGHDSLTQQVQIMRGKDTTTMSFEQQH